MNTKTLLAAALAAGSLMGLASVGHAAPAVVAGTYAAPAPYYNQAPTPYYNGNRVYSYSTPAVVVQGPPPAPIYESVPASREGYIWAPGHYVWNDGRYMWRRGEWMASRPGYAWQAAQWQQRGDGSW